MQPHLAEIKRFIARLDDDDPMVRREAQKRLEEIAKKELPLTKSPEVRRRLKELLLALREAAWEKLPETPIGARAYYSTVLWGSKLMIWGGMAGGTIGDGAILDLATKNGRSCLKHLLVGDGITAHSSRGLRL
jgi:hypothetical protein